MEKLAKELVSITLSYSSLAMTAPAVLNEKQCQLLLVILHEELQYEKITSRRTCQLLLVILHYRFSMPHYPFYSSFLLFSMPFSSKTRSISLVESSRFPANSSLPEHFSFPFFCHHLIDRIFYSCFAFLSSV